MARRQGAGRSPAGVMKWLVAVAFATPALVFVAALGTRFGAWSPAIGYDLLTLAMGRWLALAGLAAALLAVVLAVRDPRRLGLPALVAFVAAGAALGLYLYQQPRLEAPAALDATTNPQDPPGFTSAVAAARAAAEAPADPQACDGLAAIPSQLTAEQATAALQDAGFFVDRAQLFNVEGLREGFWFGFAHDAVVRIRPGRTDVRVAARDGRPQGDEACRLAREIVAALQAGA